MKSKKIFSLRCFTFINEWKWLCIDNNEGYFEKLYVFEKLLNCEALETTSIEWKYTEYWISIVVMF